MEVEGGATSSGPAPGAGVGAGAEADAEPKADKGSRAAGKGAARRRRGGAVGGAGAGPAAEEAGAGGEAGKDGAEQQEEGGVGPNAAVGLAPNQTEVLLGFSARLRLAAAAAAAAAVPANPPAEGEGLDAEQGQEQPQEGDGPETAAEPSEASIGDPIDDDEAPDGEVACGGEEAAGGQPESVQGHGDGGGTGDGPAAAPDSDTGAAVPHQQQPAPAGEAPPVAAGQRQRARRASAAAGGGGQAGGAFSPVEAEVVALFPQLLATQPGTEVDVMVPPTVESAGTTAAATPAAVATCFRCVGASVCVCVCVCVCVWVGGWVGVCVWVCVCVCVTTVYSCLSDHVIVCVCVWLCVCVCVQAEVVQAVCLCIRVFAGRSTTLYRKLHKAVCLQTRLPTRCPRVRRAWCVGGRISERTPEGMLQIDFGGGYTQEVRGRGEGSTRPGSEGNGDQAGLGCVSGVGSVPQCAMPQQLCCTTWTLKAAAEADATSATHSIPLTTPCSAPLASHLHRPRQSTHLKPMPQRLAVVRVVQVPVNMLRPACSTARPDGAAAQAAGSAGSVSAELRERAGPVRIAR